jgi:hypothetical protein
MQEYILNYKELEDRKRKALTYSQNNFNWNKNSLILLSIVREIRKRPKTMEIIEKVKSYEKTRGIRFYLANLVFYDKIKKKVKNILNKS